MISKFLSLIIIAILFTATVSGQDLPEKRASIGLNLCANSTPAMTIKPDYELKPNREVASGRSLGFEGQAIIGYWVKPKIELRVGLAVGLHSTYYALRLDSTFSTIYSEAFDDYFSDYSTWYFGWEFKGRYSIWQNKTNTLGCSAGIRGLWFFPVEGGLDVSAYLSDRTVKPIFVVNTISNPNHQVIIAPEIGLFYSKKISSRFRVGLQLEDSFSNTLEMASSTPYSLYGDNETLHGHVEKQYQQIGVGLDLIYLF